MMEPTAGGQPTWFPRSHCWFCLTRYLRMITDIGGGHFQTREADAAVETQVVIKMGVEGWITR